MSSIDTHVRPRVMVPVGEDYPEIRDGVRAICKRFPGQYWRDLEDRRAYPEAFVKEMSNAGYLAALIPQDYGGVGLRSGPAAWCWRRFTPLAVTPMRAMRRCT